MPEKATVDKAREDAREGKSPSTQAGEFVREEMDHIREGKHGARSTKQAIAIGLSKARRAGVALKQPNVGKVSSQTSRQAERDSAKGRSNPNAKPSATRSRATIKALKKEGHTAASHESLAKQARSSAKKRGASGRKSSARKAVATKQKEKRVRSGSSNSSNSSRRKAA
jgi:hypothetical protein